MIAQLVADLPEVYQPIFGHPELSGQVSRPCRDRLIQILRVHDALRKRVARPLRVLDLGCAQGFFSLSLAEQGALVTGVDFLDKNIAVCQALAGDHPQLQVSFATGRVEAVIADLAANQYDLVLGLSVFHHLVHERGLDEVRALLARAGELSGALLVELALHQEPLYWGPSQPQDPRLLLTPFAFVHEVARHPTHLSALPRPLFVASNRYWLLDGQAGEFETWSGGPAPDASLPTGPGDRRCFYSRDRVVRLYRFDQDQGAESRLAFTRERALLADPPAGFSAPTLLLSGENDSEGWTLVERLPGRLLLTVLRQGLSLDHRRLLLAVLEQLVALEAAGLYHGNVRTWNLLVTDQGAVVLLDYGSISSHKQDMAWPGDLFLSFFILVGEVVSGVADDPNRLRLIAISPSSLPPSYRRWAKTLWQQPIAAWSFRGMYAALVEDFSDPGEGVPEQPLDRWMRATEEALQAQKLSIEQVQHHLEASIRQAEVKAREALEHGLASACQAVDESAALAMKHHQQQQQLQSCQQQLQSCQQQLQSCQELLQAMYASTSWRLTAPLRAISPLFRRLAGGPGAWRRSLSRDACRRLASQMVIRVRQYLCGHPGLKAMALYGLAPFPGLKARLKRLGGQALPVVPVSAPVPAFEGTGSLSARARRIYRDLKAARARCQQGED